MFYRYLATKAGMVLLIMYLRLEAKVSQIYYLLLKKNHHFSKFECAIRFYYHCMLIHILNYDTELPNVFEILF